jgi:hypothetical protein
MNPFVLLPPSLREGRESKRSFYKLGGRPVHPYDLEQSRFTLALGRPKSSKKSRIVVSLLNMSYNRSDKLAFNGCLDLYS